MLAESIDIHVSSQYLPEQSVPHKNHWLFAYTITISNKGDQAVQLLNRHWIITNGNGEVSEVIGAGVIGQQPEIAAGEQFTYSSGCPLDTLVGTMHGEYEFRTLAEGAHFFAKIKPFRLAVPDALN